MITTFRVSISKYWLEFCGKQFKNSFLSFSFEQYQSFALIWTFIFVLPRRSGRDWVHWFGKFHLTFYISVETVATSWNCLFNLYCVCFRGWPVMIYSENPVNTTIGPKKCDCIDEERSNYQTNPFNDVMATLNSIIFWLPNYSCSHYNEHNFKKHKNILF